MRRDERYTYFYGAEDELSQWHPIGFTYKSLYFKTAEHWMMYCKAKLFNDHQVADKILASKTPREAKQLGRSVKGFDKRIWNDKCRDYVYIGNREKFSQNPELLLVLFGTMGTELVEASPSDRIWGVGLRDSDSRIKNKSQWKGTNWLGEILTKLRDDLLAKKRSVTAS